MINDDLKRRIEELPDKEELYYEVDTGMDLDSADSYITTDEIKALLADAERMERERLRSERFERAIANAISGLGSLERGAPEFTVKSIRIGLQDALLNEPQDALDGAKEAGE